VKSSTNFFARDARGMKLVVGQTVYSPKHKKTGQLLGVTHPQQICIVRFTETSEVISIAAAQLRVATWSELRQDEQGEVLRAAQAAPQPLEPSGE
jgi:hypothetical protein